MKLSKSNSLEKACLVFILQIALLVRLAFLDSIQLSSDEAIYTYTSYLITHGVVPYREIFIAHPPLNFYVTASFMGISEPSYPSIRLLSIGIFLVTVLLTYLLAKVILGELDGKYSLFVALLYALYPSWFTFNSIASSLENLLTLFALLSTLFYLLHYRRSQSRYLLLSGFFGACALLVTLRAIFFLMSLVIIHLVYVTWIRRPKQLAKSGLIFGLGFIIPIIFTLGFLALNNALQPFYLDNVTYQLSIFRMSMSDRLWYLGQYLAGEWPLLLLGGFGLSLATRIVRQTRNISVAVPGLVFFLSFLFFSFYGYLMHYLQFLCPFLSVISALGIIEVKNRILGDARKRARSKALIYLFLVILSLFFYLTATNFYQISIYFQKNPYDKVNYYVGKRIANLTSPSDYIWASDASIGFFAKRMIVAPAADFRFIGISDSIIGFDYGKDRGSEMSGYKDGFVTVEDFIQSWESKRVKVLVFIMNKGWIPYVDPFLWNGYRDHLGAAEYVQSKYELQEVVFAQDIPYIYYIWVRK